MSKPTVKEYIPFVMERDNLSWSKARRIAISEIRSGKAIGQLKIKAFNEAIDGLEKLDYVLDLMEEEQ